MYEIKCPTCGATTEYRQTVPYNTNDMDVFVLDGVLTFLRVCYLCKHPEIRYGETREEYEKRNEKERNSGS